MSHANLCRPKGRVIELFGRTGLLSHSGFWICLALILLQRAAFLADAAEPLLTRWASMAETDTPLPEYPRPQLVRTVWLNLNGWWDYRIGNGPDKIPETFDGRIRVPFPVESYLSGVNLPLGEASTLWYRRKFTIPAGWRDRQIKLHFGAVDWLARVFVNGRAVGLHRGGYDAFSFDITRFLDWKGTNELVVAVNDPTEGDQPRGKQSRKVENIFYTSSSGIWQTVWLEPVAADHIQAVRFDTELAGPSVRATVLASSLDEQLQAEVIVSFGGKEVGFASGPVGAPLAISLQESHPWRPSQPDLYQVTVRLMSGKKVQDQVESYFGLREIQVGTDATGARRLFLNGEPLFQMGVLDQGFWPDGLYTAPADEALKFDLETAKRLGFNMVRKHVKVEPERWYYWADKLGLLVWQDMPSANNTSENGRRQFEVELTRLLDQKANHPSIVTWVLFNEGWGQFDTERLTRRIKSIDPSRLVNSASGWTDLKVGDVVDLHSYPAPLAPATEPVRAAVIGEFGGLGLGITNHTWQGRQPWGYQLFPNPDKLTSEYLLLVEKAWKFQKEKGLAAAVYTQLADVETECNGFLTYDRAVLKMDPLRVQTANVHPPKLLPDARDGIYVWAYTTNAPDFDWMQPEYDASQWPAGNGGFGTAQPPGSVTRTAWNSPDIWLRREFVLPPGFKAPSFLTMYHDEDAEVYINGVPAVSTRAYSTSYVEFQIAPEALKTLRPGRNVIAIYCHQTSGGQYIDAGLWSSMEGF